MRAWSIISLLVCVGCAVRLPRPGSVGISMKTTTRVQAHVQPAAVQVTAAAPPATAQVQGGIQVGVQAPPTVVVPPSVVASSAIVAQPDVIVPLQGAPVVEFFGIPLEGVQDVVFVLDCSGSMSDPAQGRLAEIHVASAPPSAAPDPAMAPPPAPPPADAPPDQPPEPPVPPQARKIDVAQVELVDALQRLPVGTRMNVVFFNSDLEAYAPALVGLDDSGRVNLIEFVRDTAPTGSTALAPAMRIAFLMNARRIVLLSDGLGNVGGNADSVLRDAREAMRGGVRIDTIGLGRDQDRDLLNTLARESGGLYQPL